jgi:2-dehydropantoate 2-reductase
VARVAVLGPGGVGVLVGARLATSGHDVTMIARERTAAALLVDGIELRHGDETLRAQPPARTSLVEAVDLLVITVKATGLLAALARCPPGTVGDARVVPFLNGVDHVALLRSTYPAARVVPAAIRVQVTLAAPGRAVQGSPHDDVVLPGGRDADVVGDILGSAGLPIEREPDEARVLWAKLAVLAPMALLCAAEGVALGEARERRPERLAALVDEAVAAAATAGVKLDAAVIRARLAALPPEQQPSMLTDVLAGAEPELEAIAGPILRAPTARPPSETAAAVRDVLRAPAASPAATRPSPPGPAPG